MQETRKQRSTEHYGLGQSGYTAGRVEHDRSLEEQLEGQNLASLKNTDEPPYDIGEDERFTSRGGQKWEPDEDEDEEKDGDKDAAAAR